MDRRAPDLFAKGRPKNNILFLLGLVLATCPFASEAFAYEGPTFAQGLWLFQRSTEFITRHWILPNAKRVKVDAPVVRCVNPTEAMIETFRPVTIGTCQSTLPNRKNNTFVFARRCDYLGPVKTIISVESEASYRETNELLVGATAKRDIVVARRVGDCNAKNVDTAYNNDGKHQLSTLDIVGRDNEEDSTATEQPNGLLKPFGKR
jgi:hypothetical protein